MEKKKVELDKPIQPGIYPVIDNDLARDNIENDIPAADLSDFRPLPPALAESSSLWEDASWQKRV